MCRTLVYWASLMLLPGLAADVAKGLEIKINFQPQSASIPAGYLPDYGQVFGDRGNGYSYGWNMDVTSASRRRGVSSDLRYDTVIQMQETSTPATWEIAVPNGLYSIFLACGDAGYTDQIDTMDVEGTIFTDPDGRDNYDEYNGMITVTDGRLTVKPAPGGTKCKVLFIHITKVDMPKAYGPFPATGALYLDTQVTLTWLVGDYAASHNVYFGTDANDVLNGAAATFQGDQTQTSFLVGAPGSPYPDGLVPGTTYYWRIDEVNELRAGSPWKGDLWSFQVPPWTARDPYPANEADFVRPPVVLTWTPGFRAQSHIVYLDADFTDVNTATGGTPQTEATYKPVVLAKDTTYYWRVDEFDGTTVHRGQIWSFKTIPVVPITDPNLLCWWKFDEILRNSVTDFSGYDHFGSVFGATPKADGRVGGALYFDGANDYVVDETAEDYLNGLDAITVCMWIKADQITTDKGFVDGVEPDGKDRYVTMRYDAIGASWGGIRVFKMAVTSLLPSGSEYQQQLESSSNVQSTQWQHVAMTWKSADVIRFYINGIENTPVGRTDPNTLGGVITGCTKLIIGKGGMDQGTTAGWKGMIDDVRVYDFALTAQDITQAMRGESDVAWDPSPATGSTVDMKNALPLRWKPGENAVQHDVYFGTNRDAVDNASASDTTGVYRGRQTDTTYTPPEGAQWASGPYYWRIDEYNTDKTITGGRLWQFMVADFILIDDFEAYNDLNTDVASSNRIYMTWMDGWDDPVNGSTVGYPDPDFDAGEHFVETSVVHGGRQSMPYFFDDSAGYSEATMPLTYPRDWTEQGVKTLSLWFQGFPAAFLEQPAGTYTLSATGADIIGQADQFRFVYERLSGPGSIVAQVLSVENSNDWAKAGVMIRRSLDPGAPFAAVYITPGYGCRFQGRLSLGADVTTDTSVVTPEQNAIKAPYWIKMERDSADNFNGYYSADGVNWTLMSWNPQTITMPVDVYVGMALTSHNANAMCKAQFSNVTIDGSVKPGDWTNEAIGVAMPSNDAERMYVAVANTGRPPVVVYHDDPRASQIDTWTQWNIDLKKFSDQGVNLTDVDSLAIGFGNKNSSTAGGTGKMFFDDIRLSR
jgi:hypothetical protein